MSALILAQAWLLGMGFWARRTARALTPGAWTALIGLALLPTLIAVGLWLRPETGHTVAYALGKVGDAAAQPPALSSSRLPPITLLFSAYALIAFGLVVRTVRRVIRLHRVAAEATPVAADIRLTPVPLPPLALGWPTCAVLVSRADWLELDAAQRELLLAHERCHLSRRDPGMTLGLILASQMLWFNPGLRWLVARWRAAIEVRADRAALAREPDPEPYARLLLRLSRAHGLPTPTATHGDLAMRIKTLINDTPPVRLPTLVFGVAAAACAGTMAVAASPDTQPTPIKRVPPMMPGTCPDWSDAPGFELEVMADRAVSRDGRVMMFGQPTAKVGEVMLRFDVGADGVPTNIAVTKTNADCFRQPAIDAVSQWRFETGAPVHNVSNMLRFLLTFENGADVKSELDAFAGG